MTTRLRARWATVAAVVALAGGTLAVTTAPAAGAPAPIRILSVSAENVKPGDKVRVKFRVTNTGNGPEKAVVVVGGGLPCTAGCRAEPNLGPGKTRDFDATVVAPAAGPGETSGLNISVAVRLGGQNSFDYKMVYVQGPGASSPSADKPSSPVDRVSGRVRDTAGEAVSGVALTIRDSAGHEYRATSDRRGRFSIRSSAGKPIAEGRITVVASLDGYRTARTTAQGVAGDTANVQVTLAAAPVEASGTPDPAVSPLAATDETPAAQVSLAAAPTFKAVSDEGSGSLPFIMGGLLVTVGLGALVLMVARRRKTPPEPVPVGATQLMTPVRAGMDEPPTAVLPAPGFPGRYGTPPQGGIR